MAESLFLTPLGRVSLLVLYILSCLSCVSLVVNHLECEGTCSATSNNYEVSFRTQRLPITTVPGCCGESIRSRRRNEDPAYDITCCPAAIST